MKRMIAATLVLLIFSSCGTTAPPEETTAAATNAMGGERQFFTRDDAPAPEFAAVRDYVVRASAPWYLVSYEHHAAGNIRVFFYDGKPGNGEQVPFLELLLSEPNLHGIEAITNDGQLITQTLPDFVLDADVLSITRAKISRTGTAVTPPRGIKIGDSIQAIYDNYADYREAYDPLTLYTIAELYPGTPVECGVGEAGSEEDNGMIGGRIIDGDNGSRIEFLYMDDPGEPERAQRWLDLAGSRWHLTYHTDSAGTITEIEYSVGPLIC